MTRAAMVSAVIGTLLTVLLARGPSLAAQERQGQNWHEVKCARYQKAWSGALARLGTRGLGKAFLDSHEAFLASDCTKASDVCPRSTEELKLANVMVVLAMNAGTASTFPPFSCRQ